MIRNIFLIILLLISSLSINAKGSKSIDIKKELHNAGFNEMYTFPLSGNIQPAFFISKYDFVIYKNNAIILSNVMSGEEEILIKNESWNEKHIKPFCITKDTLFFSIEDNKTFQLIEYSLVLKTVKELAFIQTNNLKRKNTKYSFFDLNTLTLFIIEWANLDVLKKYEILENNKNYSEIQISEFDLLVFQYGSPLKILFKKETINNDVKNYYILNTDTKRIEKNVDIIKTESENFFRFMHIRDTVFYAINRPHRYLSEIHLLDLENKSSTLLFLKNFNHQITGIYRINNGEFCFSIHADDGYVTFCYFTLDIWGL